MIRKFLSVMLVLLLSFGVAAEVALPLAYVASMAVFFAWLGRRKGFWWVAAPILLATILGGALTVLWMNNSVLFKPAAISTVALPAVVAFINKTTGYRWWSRFTVGQPLLMAWFVVGAILLVSSIGVLVVTVAVSR